MIPEQFIRRRNKRSGTSLVELTVSTVLVGVLLSAALTSTGQSLLAQRKSADRVAASQLANGLLSEVTAKPYSDPSGGLSVLGVDLSEVFSQESSFDDVDDYHGHGESPPNNSVGVPIPGYTGWSRSVSVAWIDPITLSVVPAESGVKRISVIVTTAGGQMSTATAFSAKLP